MVPWHFFKYSVFIYLAKHRIFSIAGNLSIAGVYLSIRPVSLKNSLLKVSCSTGVFPDVSSVNNKHAAIFKKMFVFLTKEYAANICRWIRAFSRQQHNVQKQQERCETFPKIILTPTFFTFENSFPRKGLTLRNLFFTLRNLFFKNIFVLSDFQIKNIWTLHFWKSIF